MTYQTLKLEIPARQQRKVKKTSSEYSVVLVRAASQIYDIPVSLSRRFYQICMAADAEVAGEEGLTASQYGVLSCLHDVPGLDQNALTARLSIDPSHTSELLYGLEVKGLVERKVSAADRRAKLVCLTHKGVEIHNRVRPKAEAARAKLLSVLSAADREWFLEMLLNIIETNEAGSQSRPRRYKLRSSNRYAAKSGRNWADGKKI